MHHCPDLRRWSRSDSALLAVLHTPETETERERERREGERERGGPASKVQTSLLSYAWLHNCAPPNCFQKTQGLLCLAGVENAPFPVLFSCFNKEVDLATCSKRESTEERWSIKGENLSRFSFFYSHSLGHCDSMCVCIYIHAVFKGSMCSILEQIQCFYTVLDVNNSNSAGSITSNILTTTWHPRYETLLGRLHHILWIVVNSRKFIHLKLVCIHILPFYC